MVEIPFTVTAMKASIGEIAVMSVEEAGAYLNMFEPQYVKFLAERERIMAEARLVLTMLRGKVGIANSKLRGGRPAAKYKLIHKTGKVPEHIREGRDGLVMLFPPAYASMATKGTQALKERHPDDPSKWHLLIKDYEVYLLPS